MLEPLVENDGALLKFVQKRGFIIDNSSHSFKRFFKETPVDISSKDTEDRIVKFLNDYLDKYPFIDYLGLWSSDGWGGRVIDTPEAIPLDYPDNRPITPEIDFRNEYTFILLAPKAIERARMQHKAGF